ncbi:hypothetical protein XENOCAPTIV_008752 [Xenoophorus captivus]|uniref:Uncharacterized protein n=1 Tax=Xenoophorus captivus TaxID=1517983 RepID=A0ABV0RPN4_9TELE
MTPPPASSSPPDSLSHFYMILPLACVGVSVLLFLLVLLVRRRLCRKAAGGDPAALCPSTRRTADITEATDSDPAALYSSMQRRTDVPEAGTDPGSGNSSVRRHSDIMYGTVSIRMKSRREHPAEPESDVVYSLLKATVAPPHESDPPCC